MNAWANDIAGASAGLDDNQRMLADSAARYLERGYTDAVRAASSAHEHGCEPARWAEFAELGWLALPVPEADGGLGGGLLDICVLAEALGQGLVVEPFVASAVLGGMLLADAADHRGGNASASSVARAWLPSLADGSRRVALAPREGAGAHDGATVATRARREGDGGGVACGDAWRLDGDKALAPGVAGADGVVVAARTGAGTLGLFLLEAGGSGFTARPAAFYDGRHGASLQLRDAPATLLAEGADEAIARLLRTALDRAALAHAAETVGTMARAFALTRDYVTTRRQFGRPIASNQVIQHRLVDLYVEIEEARALVRAAASASSPSSSSAPMVAAALACVTEVASHVWEESIQLHGAIGMTEECAVGPCVRRLALASSLYGNVHHHLDRLAGLSLGAAA